MSPGDPGILQAPRGGEGGVQPIPASLSSRTGVSNLISLKAYGSVCFGAGRRSVVPTPLVFTRLRRDLFHTLGPAEQGSPEGEPA